MKDGPQSLVDLNLWLIPLIPSFDMDSNITKNKQLKVTLKKTSKTKNICFWGALATPECLELYWGIQGSKGNSRTIPAQNCSGRNPARELQERINAKLRGAYTLKDYDSITI